MNAINVMRGAESVSTYQPIPEAEKFRIEYWGLEEAKLQRLPKPKPLAGRVAFVTGAGSGIGRAIAHRLAAEGACVVVADRRRSMRRRPWRPRSGSADVAVAVTVDVTEAEQVAAALAEAVLAFGGVDLVVNNAGLSISKPLLDTTERDWDLQHDVMAKGSFLVAREAARVMIDQGDGRRHRLHLEQERGLRRTEQRGLRRGQGRPGSPGPAPGRRARRARHPGQRHQPRRRGPGLGHLRQGLGRTARRGLRRAEDELGAFYAQRTLLKREVLPEHVAAAVFALVSGDLSLTTGLHIPVDAGVAAAFLR